MWFRFCLHAVLFKFFARFLLQFFQNKVFFFVAMGFRHSASFFFWQGLEHSCDWCFFTEAFFFSQGCYVLFATECCFFNVLAMFFFARSLRFFFVASFFLRWTLFFLQVVLCFVAKGFVFLFAFGFVLFLYELGFLSFFLIGVLCRFQVFFFLNKMFFVSQVPMFVKEFFFFEKVFFKGFFLRFVFSKRDLLFQSRCFLKGCCCCFPHFLQGLFSSFCVFHVVFHSFSLFFVFKIFSFHIFLQRKTFFKFFFFGFTLKKKQNYKQKRGRLLTKKRVFLTKFFL